MPNPPTTEPISLPTSFERFVLLLAASKGGSGKSTLSVNLGVTAHVGGLKTVIFDTDIEDGQQSCVQWSETRNISGPVVRKASLSRIGEALAWADRKGFEFIVIDAPGRDMVGMKTAFDHADFMVTPNQPSPLDLRATAPIRRLWGVSKTPGAIVLNGVMRETVARTRAYIDRYAEIGTVLPAVVGRRVQYVDAIEKGLGVSEYNAGAVGDREMRRLLSAIFTAAARRRVAR